jgi:hypothetical protein
MIPKPVLMTVEYFLDQDDCLEFQLFDASKSERIKKKRQKSKIRIPVLYLILGCLFYLLNSNPLALTFIIIGVLWFFIYPVWLSKFYIKHYRDFIKEKWTENSSESSIVQFETDAINIHSKSGEAKINIRETKEITETPKLILLKFKSGSNIIFPKGKISNSDELRRYLQALALRLNVEYTDETQWTWK